jgi:antitoxin (DNA-binding transcriptional repressor) of toxin-antitoxin stability system
MPESISDTELGRRTRHYVERAAAGESFIITTDGNPAAWMVQLPDAHTYDLESLEAFATEYQRIHPPAKGKL